VRIEAGEDRIRRRPVALDEVIEAAVELTRPLLDQRGQQLTVELPYPLPAVEGDAPRLTQVFVNLLGNANKFAPAGSALRIGGEVRSNEIALWVEDEGPGLPTGSEARLFGRFVRTVSPENQEPEESGMGLGLWIVKSIVERHGGRVEALAAHPGTRVRLVLPTGERA
jgi:signal transduction histidine kinase